jgi:hypothetical protein
MSVEPADTGVTTPLAVTVATEGALLDQLTPVPLALDGAIVAVKVLVPPPTLRLNVAGLRLTPVTAT